MNRLTLKKESPEGSTSVSNLFLDQYMPRANGEYVKVYLYLLRALGDNSPELSVAHMAEQLEHTESDILRALKYWEKQRLLTMECDASNTLQGICLLDIPAPQRPQEAPGVLPQSPPENYTYSRSQLQEFSERAECRQLLFVCEQYLGKTLSPSETETLLYFYDQLRFSPDLIEYLVEYCVSKGSKSMHYIRKVALSWDQAQIRTVAQAKERTTTYTRNTFAILKAFGISDRNPVEPELRYIERWLSTFSPELVLEACSRTMERLHKPNFGYADRILQSWQEHKVRHLEDIKALDQAHQDRASSRRCSSPSAKATRFTNFEQRDYDFEELEKQLLSSQQ